MQDLALRLGERVVAPRVDHDVDDLEVLVGARPVLGDLDVLGVVRQPDGLRTALDDALLECQVHLGPRHHDRVGAEPAPGLDRGLRLPNPQFEALGHDVLLFEGGEHGLAGLAPRRRVGLDHRDAVLGARLLALLAVAACRLDGEHLAAGGRRVVQDLALRLGERVVAPRVDHDVDDLEVLVGARPIFGDLDVLGVVR